MFTSKINKEQYLKLLPLERQLRSGLMNNYARLSVVEFEAFCALYAEIYGAPLSKSEASCNSCKLKAIKKVANEFFSYRESYFSKYGRNPEDPKPEKENNLNIAEQENAQA